MRFAFGVSAVCYLRLLVLAFVAAIAPGRALAQRPMGIDVSHYQGTITWSSVKSSGISFAWAKASEGTGYVDPTYAANTTNAKAAGVFIGPYHFANYTNNQGTAGADLEAAHYWSVIKNYVKTDGLSLMPMLDVEQSPVGGGYTKATLSV